MGDAEDSHGGPLEDLVDKYGDQVRTAPLDVTDEDAAHAAGRLDVVVNNAGYGDIAPFVTRAAVAWPFPAALGTMLPSGPLGEVTPFGVKASKETPDLLPDYEPSVGQRRRRVRWPSRGGAISVSTDMNAPGSHLRRRVTAT